MRARAIAWSAAVLGGAMMVAALSIELLRGTIQEDPGTALAGLLVLMLSAVGLLLVVRAGALVVGGLMLGLGTYLEVVGLANDVTDWVADVHGTGSTGLRLAIALGSASWVTVLGTVATIAFVFPDGRTMTRRWGIALRVSFCAYAATATSIVLADRPSVEPPFENVPGPFAVPAWVYGGLFVIGWPLTLVSLFAAAAALVVRYRRSTGSERLQLKWFAWSVIVIPATLFTVGFTWLVLGRVLGALVGVLFLASIGLPTVAIGIAVMRYRLYAIDRIVNRTLVYGTLTVLLGGAWLGLALGLGVAVGRGSPFAAAAATLAVALVFTPLRRRIQERVDRRFDRARYEAVARVRGFEDGVRAGTVEPEGLVDVLRAALHDRGADLFYRVPEEDAHVDREAQTLPPPEAGDPRTRSTIEHRGEDVAVLLHDPSLLERPELLRGVLEAASLTAEMARLRIVLGLQLAEVERSRARLVRAGYEERRRIERDLHDGAQQRLVSLGIRLRRMQWSLPAEVSILRPALDEAVDEVANAIEDLRTIAAGVRPALLDEGLAAALAGLARTAPVPVDLRVESERLPPAVEEAAYFVASEALTNAVKHASASWVRVEAGRLDGALQLTIADDGVGGARPGRGSGLVGLADRVEAQGGRLTIESPPGGGTRVEVVIPCAS